MEKKYEICKQKLLEELKKVTYFASITDGRQAKHTLKHYLTVTVHYISPSSGQLKTVTFQTMPIKESHTGENIALLLEQCYTDWGGILGNYFYKLSVS